MKKITNYRVLARKYRPKIFSDLVGQDVLTRTLSNAISGNRIYHAFVLTGMRGVGKTTTARIIARSINCLNVVNDDNDNLLPCNECDQCKSIDGGNNVDVIEIDAASNTGVSNIREIIENVKYRPVSSKYKVYVIDEVHMLSTAAFNALLKTLEEPPSHIVFILATTEIRKVPITVLSRCQRFDLSRISNAQMVDHLSNVADKENVKIELDSLSLISNASEGSVKGWSFFTRPGYCILVDWEIEETKLRKMLGLSSKLEVVSLFSNLLKGEIQEALGSSRRQYDRGIDPTIMIQELMSLCHWVTRYKITENPEDDVTISDQEKNNLIKISNKVSFANLSRFWQMLLKGLEDSNKFSSNVESFEMLVVRICYSSHLPDPNSLIKSIQEKKKIVESNSNISGLQKINLELSKSDISPQVSKKINFLKGKETNSPEKVVLESFSDLINLTEKKDEFILRSYLLSNVHIISFENGKISLRLAENTPNNFINQLSLFLSNMTGLRWLINLSDEEGEQTVKEKQMANTQAIKKKVEVDPVSVYSR